MKKFVRNQVPVVAWIVIIFWLSSIHKIPSLPIPLSDKIAHATFYCILCGLTFRAFFLQDRLPALKRFAVLAAFLFTILYGVTDELHQLFVWGRTSDILDVLADSVGGIVCTAFIGLYGYSKSVAAARDSEE